MVRLIICSLFCYSFSTIDKSENVQIGSLLKQQLRGAKSRVYNFSKIKKSKKWLKNILLDRSDFGDSDFEINGNNSDDYVRDMIRFHNLQKKVKRELNNGLEASQYHNFSSSLLPSAGSDILYSNNIKEKRNISKTNSKGGNKRKACSSTSPVSVLPFNHTPVPSDKLSNIVKINSTTSMNITSNSNSISNDKTLSKTATTSTSTVTLPSNSLLSDPLINDSKRIKLETKMLDEIPYDTTLPDEILQSESSATAPDLGSSCIPVVNNEIFYSSQLPDEIFDNEESSASLYQLQTSKSFSLPSNLTQYKNVSTSESRSNSPALIINTKGKGKSKSKSSSKDQEASMNLKRKRLWIAIVRKEIPRAQKQKLAARKETLTNCKKMVNWCQREKRKLILLRQKQYCRDQFSKIRRLTKEMLAYWKHYEKFGKDFRKKAEKEAQEQLKIDIEMMEAKRQQRKLNFLITQTELYAHFMSRKIPFLNQIEATKTEDEILGQLDEEAVSSSSLDISDDYNSKAIKEKVLSNVEGAIQAHQKQTLAYSEDSELTFTEPSKEGEELLQPEMFEGILKSYQLKGMSWLYYLYMNGINGILADEMGLGKTIQTIAFLSLLAEKHSIWGPFLIVAPASTLHNWQQELARFTPKFKTLPYWGNQHDRKVLRKFWNSKYLHREEASFHILITSYQLIVQDVKCFQRIKWMYMVLDEAQAIKSVSSIRWKHLLLFQCRNRLLLSGTPIQNTMAELWALLHFIMPTLFDSHEEFAEWFSKDIESQVENKGTIDEKHLSRLHMILKPFILRRIKKDVENELSEKIEILIKCGLTQRQELLYQAIKNKISIEELVQSSNSASTTSSSVSTSSLMNLVMQFRKVSNHPDLFERRDIRTPLFIKLIPFVFSDLLFSEGLICDSFSFNPLRHKILYNILNIFSAYHIYQATYTSSSHSSCFDFLSLINLSIEELRSVIFGNMINLWNHVLQHFESVSKKLDKIVWKEDDPDTRDILIIPSKTTILSFNAINSSNNFHLLLFTSNWTNHFNYCHTSHTLHYVPESVKHREMRLRKYYQKKLHKKSPLNEQLDDSEFIEVKHIVRSSRELPCQPTSMPKFLFIPFIAASNGSKVISAARDVTCYKQRAGQWQYLLNFGGNPFIQRLFNHGNVKSLDLHSHLVLKLQDTYFFPQKLGGLLGLNANNGWSPILIPNKETLVSDSGKLIYLDCILKKLKKEGHRVLIYSQMTRMIDLLEEYMIYRGYIYMRLDGSSRINERRDMVTDFQTRSDIFVFLLSTRAGGLGINLTAADTVIFYDSDWNPTVDQQAMDRAHRLGQTKQVTVYRLICQDTIEERILQRAQEKSEIQRMVISGGSTKSDTLKAKEMVSLLLDNNELERKFKARQEERKQTIESDKTKSKNRSEGQVKVS